VIPDGKGQFKEIKEKDWDNDLVEVPDFGDLFNPVVNPAIDRHAVQFQDLSQRLERLDGIMTRPAFIRAEERPDVGPRTHGEEPEG